MTSMVDLHFFSVFLSMGTSRHILSRCFYDVSGFNITIFVTLVYDIGMGRGSGQVRVNYQLVVHTCGRNTLMPPQVKQGRCGEKTNLTHEH